MTTERALTLPCLAHYMRVFQQAKRHQWDPRRKAEVRDGNKRKSSHSRKPPLAAIQCGSSSALQRLDSPIFVVQFQAFRREVCRV